MQDKIKTIREKIIEARTGEKNVPNEKERFTLSDVLLAIEKKHHNPISHMSIDGYIEVKMLLERWKLKDDNLNNQSSETIDFIYELVT